MVTAAAETKRKLTDEDIDLIKARSAATDNFGNFFAQNLFVATAGVLLIASTMKSLNHPVEPMQVVLASIPVALITLVIVAIYNRWFDRQFEQQSHKGGK